MLVFEVDANVVGLGVGDDESGGVLAAVLGLMGPEPEVIVGDLGDDFPGPDLLVDEGVAVVYTDDEVDAGPEDEGLVVGDVEGEGEGVLEVGVEAERQYFVLYSSDCFGIGVNLVDAEPKFGGVYQHDLEHLPL